MVFCDNRYIVAFSIVDDGVEGNTDIPEFQVIKGDRTGFYGMVDRYGVVIIPCIYDFLKVYIDYNLCSVVKDFRNAILTTDGQTVIPFGEINPLGMFTISHSLVCGYNTIYDLQGNLKIQLAADDRVILLSDLYASTLRGKGLYSLDTGEILLNDEYVADKIIDTHLIIVNKVTNGFTRYGVYDCCTKSFALPIEFTSIQYLSLGKYEARAQYKQECGTTKSRMLLFSIQAGTLEVEREDAQQYQISGTGCLLMLLLPLLLPIALLYLL